MLENDGHLIRIPGQKLLWPLDPGGPCLERQIEVVRAGQPAGRIGAFQCGLHNASQGFLSHRLVIHEVFSGGILGHSGPVRRG